jgi:hypothetical protein
VCDNAASSLALRAGSDGCAASTTGITAINPTEAKS